MSENTYLDYIRIYRRHQAQARPDLPDDAIVTQRYFSEPWEFVHVASASFAQVKQGAPAPIFMFINGEWTDRLDLGTTKVQPGQIRLPRSQEFVPAPQSAYLVHIHDDFWIDANLVIGLQYTPRGRIPTAYPAGHERHGNTFTNHKEGHFVLLVFSGMENEGRQWFDIGDETKARELVGAISRRINAARESLLHRLVDQKDKEVQSAHECIARIARDARREERQYPPIGVGEQFVGGHAIGNGFSYIGNGFSYKATAPLRIGDPVSIKPEFRKIDGGEYPVMHIDAISDDGMALCRWTRGTGLVERHEFPIDQLA